MTPRPGDPSEKEVQHEPEDSEGARSQSVDPATNGHALRKQRVRAHTYIHMYMYIYILIFIHMCMRICISIYVHIYIHTPTADPKPETLASQ